MAYIQYYKQEKYVNGSPTGEYRRGDATGNTYDTYEECMGDTPTGIEYRWVTIENQWVCDGTTKYTKEKQQQSTDGGTTWEDVSPVVTRKGSTVIERNSEDCGATKVYRWYPVYPTEYICDEYSKCIKMKKQYSFDETLWYDVSPAEYKAGDIVEVNSTYCGYHEITYVEITGEFICKEV